MKNDSHNQLFRKQAVEDRYDTLLGDVKLKITLNMALATVFLGCWVFIFFYWLVNGTYAKKVTVKGWVEPSSGVVKAYPSFGTSAVEKIYFKDGKKVKKGDAVLKLKVKSRSSQELDYYEMQVQEFINQKELLADDIKRNIRLNRLRETELLEKKDITLSHADSDNKCITSEGS